MKRLRLSLTKKCNEKCYYCPLKNFDCKFNIYNFIEDLNIISNNYKFDEISLLGGEIGLLNKQYLEQVLDKTFLLNKKIFLYTNGYTLITYRDLITKYNFYEIDYHITLKNAYIDNFLKDIIKYKFENLRFSFVYTYDFELKKINQIIEYYNLDKKNVTIYKAHNRTLNMKQYQKFKCNILNKIMFDCEQRKFICCELFQHSFFKLPIIFKELPNCKSKCTLIER